MTGPTFLHDWLWFHAISLVNHIDEVSDLLSRDNFGVYLFYEVWGIDSIFAIRTYFYGIWLFCWFSPNVILKLPESPKINLFQSAGTNLFSSCKITSNQFQKIFFLYHQMHLKRVTEFSKTSSWIKKRILVDLLQCLISNMTTDSIKINRPGYTESHNKTHLA